MRLATVHCAPLKEPPTIDVASSMPEVHSDRGAPLSDRDANAAASTSARVRPLRAREAPRTRRGIHHDIVRQRSAVIIDYDELRTQI